MRVDLIKVCADGEQVSVQYNVGEKAIQAHRMGQRHLREELAPMFDLIDARLLEMNGRIMASNFLINKLSPEARFAVNNVMDVLHGRAQGPAVEAILKEREAELQAQRAEAERHAREEETLLAQLTNQADSPLQGSKLHITPQSEESPARRARRPKPQPAQVVDPDIPGGM